MTIFIDFSGARPGAARIKSNGIAGVSRYLSAEVSNTVWKRATKDEIAEYRAAGIDVILNWEWYEGRMLEGYNAGVADGKVALKQAQWIGYPKGASIYFSHDTSARDDAAVRDYLRGAQSALGDYYVTDIYSGIDVVEMALDAGLARYGWQTAAWSGGRIGRCHAYQNLGMWFNSTADEDEIRHTPLGSWEDALAVAPVPTPKPVPAPVPKPAPKPTVVYHTVQSGEYLGLIASRYKTTVSHLVAWNKAKYPSLVSNPNNILVGWKLIVSSTAPVAVYHTVKAGETLSGIADYYKTTVSQLLSWNRNTIDDKDLILVGMRLRVR